MLEFIFSSFLDMSCMVISVWGCFCFVFFVVFCNFCGFVACSVMLGDLV